MNDRMFYLLVRRVKRNMAMWGMAAGGIFLPLGVSLLVFATTLESPTAFFAFGVIFMVLGLASFLGSFKATLDEEYARRHEEERRHNELLDVLKDIRSSINRR